MGSTVGNWVQKPDIRFLDRALGPCPACRLTGTVRSDWLNVVLVRGTANHLPKGRPTMPVKPLFHRYVGVRMSQRGVTENRFGDTKATCHMMITKLTNVGEIEP